MSKGYIETMRRAGVPARILTDEEETILHLAQDPMDKFWDARARTLEGKVTAEKTHYEAIKAEVTTNPRYLELLAVRKDVHGRGETALAERHLSRDDWGKLYRELAAFEHMISDAEGAVIGAENDKSDGVFQRAWDSSASAFLMGQMDGFRLGVKVAMLMTAKRLDSLPGLDPDTLPADLVISMLDNTVALQLIAKIRGEEYPDVVAEGGEHIPDAPPAVDDTSTLANPEIIAQLRAVAAGRSPEGGATE